MVLLLFVLWIAFNGGPTVEILIFGVVFCVALFVFMNRALGYTLRRELKVYMVFPLILLYVLGLVWEIIKANIQTVGIVFHSRKRPVRPQVVEFNTPLKSDFCRVLLANSITLTPGTITIKLKGNRLRVHCLDESLSEGIDATVFEKRLERIEARWMS